MEHMSYIQTLRGWDLVVSPESHYDGVTLLARYAGIQSLGRQPATPLILSYGSE